MTVYVDLGHEIQRSGSALAKSVCNYDQLVKLTQAKSCHNTVISGVATQGSLLIVSGRFLNNELKSLTRWGRDYEC